MMATQPETSTRATDPPTTTAFKKKKPFPRPKPQLTADRALHKPKHLSTTSTPLTNDPLWLDSLVLESEAGLISKETIKDFKADAAGYVSLIEHEYAAISDCDKNVTKALPQSVYAYFHHVIWWYKVALIARKHGRASDDQKSLIDFVESYEDLVVGAGAATYLAGMGDFTDMTGVRHYLSAIEPNEDGHFGLINGQTHRDYETLIAPAVSFTRVMSDCASKLNRGGDYRMPDGILPQGELPRLQAREALRHARPQEIPLEPPNDQDVAEGIEEEEENDVVLEQPRQEHQYLPTANLLGWKHAAQLSKNQIAEMLKIFPFPEDHDFEIRRYQVNRELFEFAHRRVLSCQRFKTMTVPKSPIGSIAQQLAWKPTSAVFSRNRQAISTMGKVVSCVMVPTRIVSAARVLCYRTIRAQIKQPDGQVVDPWCSIHWNRYTNVPGEWSGNRNHYLVHGSRGLYDHLPFSSSMEERDDAVISFLNKFKAS